MDQFNIMVIILCVYQFSFSLLFSFMFRRIDHLKSLYDFNSSYIKAIHDELLKIKKDKE